MHDSYDLNLNNMQQDKELVNYVADQLHGMIPIKLEKDKILLQNALKVSIKRLKDCFSGIRIWDSNKFNILQSQQYCTFLYLLANTIWKETGETSLPTRLFLLNKALNSIELFYEVNMPKVFLIGHSVGSVFAKAVYGNRIVFFQNVTVGRVGSSAPVIGENVVLYPQAVVSGASRIGNNCVVSAGCVIHNRNIPDNNIVYQRNGELIIEPNDKKHIDLYLNNI